MSNKRHKRRAQKIAVLQASLAIALEQALALQQTTTQTPDGAHAEVSQ
jgi:hypothetical protein